MSAGVRIDPVQEQPGHERVMGAEPAGQRLGQRRDLRTHPPFARSAMPAGSRLARRSALRSIARPDTPVMSVATEDNLIPASSRSFSSRWISRVRSRVIMVRARVRSRSSRIGAGGTNEARTSPWAPRSASQAASETSVLRPGTFLHVAGVDQHHLEVRLQQVVERLPIVAGRLHHHARDLLGDQMIPQREDLVGHRTPRRHRRRVSARTVPLDPDADLRVLLRDVDPRAPRVHHFHHLTSLMTEFAVVEGVSGRAE